MDIALLDIALLVIAKEPLPGRVKTRLCPPCTPTQAATLAEASLRDTLAAVTATPAARRLLVFEGDPEGIRPDGFEVISQRGEGLGQRLAAAFTDVGGPALLVGMDSPQLCAAHLERTLELLTAPGVDAVIAPTFDGGYWCVGFREPVPGAFAGVPMSTTETYAAQLRRFAELGLRVAVGEQLTDVDTYADAEAVAAAAPQTRFAQALTAMATTRESFAA